MIGLTCFFVGTGTYAAEVSQLLSNGVSEDAKGLFVRRRVWQRTLVLIDRDIISLRADEHAESI